MRAAVPKTVGHSYGSRTAGVRVVLSMSLLALLSSCIARSGVAVSGSASSVTIHLARCSAHERIVDVRVAQVGRNEIPDDRDDIVLWRAQSKQGVPVNSVTVGNPPEGLDETIPLTH